MPNFIIAYHGGKKFENPEEGAKHKEEWQTWISNLGDAVVNPGNPLRNSKTVSADSVKDSHESDLLTGYSIIKADSMDDALEIAIECPFLVIGTIEVAEIMEMK
ncbi:MAG: hypothetical protein HGN29_09930 [Asgard group archaeon]|nr:hypothetical protein [Asgard group archaeon]